MVDIVFLYRAGWDHTGRTQHIHEPALVQTNRRIAMCGQIGLAEQDLWGPVVVNGGINRAAQREIPKVLASPPCKACDRKAEIAGIGAAVAAARAELAEALSKVNRDKHGYGIVPEGPVVACVPLSTPDVDIYAGRPPAQMSGS